MKPTLALLTALLLTPLASLQAAQLHGLFTDNMVLQREKPLAIYGAGDEGEIVTVELNGQTFDGGGKHMARTTPVCP